MLVTILTAVYNGEKSIANTIESVLNQTYRDIEYIILDGCSQDSTVEIAKSYIDRFAQTDGKRLTVISEPDKGLYDALNKGASMAHGTLVGQINADDTYEYDAVSNMVAFYENTNYDVAWGNINIITSRNTFVKHGKVRYPHMTGCLCHPAMFSKRTILLEYPYALENMKDDLDFVISVYEAGKKVLTTDKLIANYRLDGQSHTQNWQDIQKHLKLLEDVYRKHNISKRILIYDYLYQIIKLLVGRFL